MRVGEVDWSSVSLWVPTVFVGVVVQTGVGLESPWTGSDLALAASALLLAVPLLIRRQHPLMTSALVAASLPVQMTLGGSLGFGSFVAVIFAAYGSGRWAARLRVCLVADSLILGGVLLAQREALTAQPDELFFPVFYVAAATVVGRVVGRLSAQSSELSRLNAALTAQIDLTAGLAAATERNRISRDLHDSVAHTLMVTVVQAEAAEDGLASDPEATREALQRIQETGRAGLAELRDTVRLLRETVPGAARDLRDLPALAAALTESGVEVTLETMDCSDLDPSLSAELYRVTQEGLTNVIKHSVAGRALLRVTRDAGGMIVEVADPGPAARGDPPPGGHGLAGMGERLAPYGGRVQAGPDGPDGAGWRVRAEVPT